MLSVAFFSTDTLVIVRGVHSARSTECTDKGPHIRFTFKHVLVIIGLGVLRGMTILKNGLSLFFTYGLTKPMGAVGRGLFRIFLFPTYSRYSKIRQRVKTHPRLAGVRSFGHFLERYAVYAALVTLGVLAVGNNIFARTIRPDEIGRGAIWASFTNSENSELIVETAASQPVAKNHATTVAIGGVSQRTDTVTNTAAATDGLPTSAPLAVGGAIPSEVGDEGGIDRQETIPYTVATGDTLSTIAHRFGLTSKTLVWANGMSDKDFIKPGQVLKIPPVEGYLYTVKKGDTLASIIKKYGGDQTKVLETNHLASADAIQPNQEIIIPGGEPPAPTPTPSSRTPLLNQVYGGTTGGTPPPSAPSSKARFVWPTSNHKINQYFRGRYHTGVDIEGTYSSPIYAAAAGRVVYAAFDRSGYGLHIVINHGNGYETLYGHASKIFVGVGDQVKQGQTIAMVGSTGRSTGTHLHYEIRTGGGFLNPLSFY